MSLSTPGWVTVPGVPAASGGVTTTFSRAAAMMTVPGYTPEAAAAAGVVDGVTGDTGVAGVVVGWPLRRANQIGGGQSFPGG